MPALSYAHGAADVPLLGETIGANLRRTVDRFPDREALVVPHQGYRATYREFWRQVGVAARGLIARGVKTGDRVGVWSPNRYEWVILQFATARMGAILVTVNPAYRAMELEHVLKQSGTSLIFLSQGLRGASYPTILDQIRDRCQALRDTVHLDRDWEAFLTQGESINEDALARMELRLQFDDPINIQFTSGTTGAPKGATLSHHNILNNGYFVGRRINYTERDRVCIPVPFYHCFGMVLGNLACTSHGACMVIPGETFDPAAVLGTVQTERCTSLYGVPTMFMAELHHPRFSEFNLSSLRTGIMAGAPCPVEVMRQVRSRMNMEEVSIAYGMTETSPVSIQTMRDDPLEKRVATVGRPLDHVEVKIVDPATGAVVPRGVAGEQCTRGYLVMLGYWDDEVATRRAIDRARWMHTGDLAVMDDDGHVRIVGRIKDVIIRGGENIYPREVEEFLHTIPGVAEAQVIGIPSARYGEEVVAWVRLAEGCTLTAEALRVECVDRIAAFKVPRHWKFVTSFPMTVTGKVQKYRMREIAAEELGSI